MRKVLFIVLLALFAFSTATAQWTTLGPGVQPRVRDAITELRDRVNEESVNYARSIENGNRVVYVDVANTSGAEDGKTWGTAWNTLTEGINAARYDYGTTDLDDDKNQHAYVFIAPGQYNKTSYTSVSGYGLHLIGVARGNGDYGVTINYDGLFTGLYAPLVGSVCEFELANMTICVDKALPAMHLMVADYVKIHNVYFKGDNNSCTVGLQIDNAKHVEIYDCIFAGWETAGIHITGGADQYFIFNNIHDNIFLADASGTAGGAGILIDNTSTSYGSVIRDNVFALDGQGSGAFAVDNNSTSTTHSCFIINNMATGDASFTAFTSTQRGMWNNAQSANGTMSLAVDDD